VQLIDYVCREHFPDVHAAFDHGQDDVGKCVFMFSAGSAFLYLSLTPHLR
jgi:hypothetical protein